MKKITIPWWLRPWSEVRAYRRTRLADLEVIQSQELVISKQEREINSLRGQLAAAVTDARTSGAALSTAKPEFVLVGIPRGPGMGKRLMASRDLQVTAFAMTEMDDPPPRWKIGAILERLLIIDKPTYGEALEHMATIWGNWDRGQYPEHSARPVSLERGRRILVQLPAAPGIGPAGDAEQVHGEAGEPDKAETESAHPVQAAERDGSGDDEQDDRSDGEHG